MQFYCIGGVRVVRKPVSIWCDHNLPSHSATHLLRIELIRLLIVKCWSTSLQWLCGVAGYWQDLEHAVIYADPELPKHAQWVTCPVSSLVFQRLFALESKNFNTIKPHQSVTHPHCCNTCTYDYIHTNYTWIDKVKCCNWPQGQLQHSLKCN